MSQSLVSVTDEVPADTIAQELRDWVQSLGKRVVSPALFYEIESYLIGWAERHELPVPKIYWRADVCRLWIGPIDADEFSKIVGRPPERDDLHRVNCDVAGTLGHMMCGWCEHHSKPRFICGCVHRVQA